MQRTTFQIPGATECASLQATIDDLVTQREAVAAARETVAGDRAALMVRMDQAISVARAKLRSCGYDGASSSGLRVNLRGNVGFNRLAGLALADVTNSKPALLAVGAAAGAFAMHLYMKKMGYVH